MRNRVFNLRKTAALAMAVFVMARASAQNPDLFFEKPFPYQDINGNMENDKPYCYVIDVAPEDGSEGYCLMTLSHEKKCQIYEASPPSPPLIIKVSQKGEWIGELTLGYKDCHSFVHGVYQAHDDPHCFLAVGTKHDNVLHYDKPFMAKFDHNLNLLWQKEINLPEDYSSSIYTQSSFMDSDGNIVSSSYLYDCGNFEERHSRFIFRLTPEGELDGVTSLPFHSRSQQAFEFPDKSGDYGILEELYTWNTMNDTVVLLRMNRDLELVDRQNLPRRYEEMDPTNLYPMLTFLLVPPQFSRSQRHAVIPFPDGSLILSNEADITHQDITQGIYESRLGIGFLWVDSNGEPFSCAIDGEYASHDSIVISVPVLPAGDDGFYFVYMMGGNSYEYVHNFVVGKMDFCGNLLWRRYWNRFFPEYDMKVYWPQNAMLSHDGGCLITGFSYKSNINHPENYEYKPDVFLLKFFSDGSLSTSDTGSGLHVRPYRLYPNPVKDRLRLSFSPDVVPVMAELFDSMGRLVLSQDNGLETIVMESLPAGVYTLRVTLGNGTSYSDPVVKQ